VLDKSAAQTSARSSGPLAGFRIVEFAGIGPGPFACMMLADMGAEVVTLDRVGAKKNLKAVAVRGRKVVELDLKDKTAITQVLDLLANADALIEGFRPGVMERLGLGPDVVLARKETPTSYHLAVVVDDARQGVTHVVRGQDLFWSTSVHRVLQALLGLPAPNYHHHRLILDAEGKKLSKSTRATALRALRESGATAADIRRMVGLA